MKSSKKSETLDIRISHADKQALQAKASEEGLTVSHVLRKLISNYLSQPETRSQPNRLMELFMTLKSKPKSVLATALACIALPFTFSSLAAAEEVSLRINGEYTQPVVENGVEGKRIRQFGTDVHFSDGGHLEFEPFPGSNLSMAITVKEKRDQLLIEMIIQEGDKLIAKPSFMTHFDTPIRMEVGEEGGEIFILDALPTKL